jgi:hypothetical protein
MTLVKVYTDIGEPKPIVLIAKIFRKVRNTYKIKYLSPTDRKYNDRTIYAYENIIYEIDEDSIIEHLNTDDERVVGFMKNEHGFTKINSDDSDYVPSESGESESDSEEDEDAECEDEDEEVDCEDEDIEEDCLSDN